MASAIVLKSESRNDRWKERVKISESLKKNWVLGAIALMLLGGLGLTRPLGSTIGLGPTLAYFRSEADQFHRGTILLNKLVHEIEPAQAQSISRAREALVDCRLKYKRIEFFLEYFFRSAAGIYNSPPKVEVEEPFMEFEEPRGMQVIEASLFRAMNPEEKNQAIQQAEALCSSAADLKSLLYDFRADDPQILESLRIELIRVIALGTAGFDAPLLKSGIRESGEAFKSMERVLAPYLNPKFRESDSTFYYLKKSLLSLEAHPDFDSFDRLSFLKESALPLQRHLGLWISEMKLDLNTTGTLNYNSDDLFSPNSLFQEAYNNTGIKSNSLRIELGKMLFFEKALSGNYSRNCASCHRPENYFTDQLPRGLAYDNRHSLKRNTPSLYYSGFQTFQFWDGRSGTLEEQICQVMQNPEEMDAPARLVLERLQASKKYRAFFATAFMHSLGDSITMGQVAGSIACYLRSLAPRNSAFDRYILGDPKAMTREQISGFNLFMGKAQCGTCHFAPLFNGLLPPYYRRTETEVLGLPMTDDLSHPALDPDSGRFGAFPISYYIGAFKTPTVRNSAATAPYMHHGGFSNLQTVLDFYNKGGGQGLGMNVPDQTLSPIPLKLTQAEIQDIISFLQSLTDAI
jgi:cytochrome c peroxidase